MVSRCVHRSSAEAIEGDELLLKILFDRKKLELNAIRGELCGRAKC